MECLKISNFGATWLCDGCHSNLECLSLSKVQGLNDTCPESLMYGSLSRDLLRVPKLTRLIKLNLSYCTDFTDEGLLSFLPHAGPSLIELNLTGCMQLTPTGLLAISSCRNLEVLYLTAILSIDDEVLSRIARACQNLKYAEEETFAFNEI